MHGKFRINVILFNIRFINLFFKIILDSKNLNFKGFINGITICFIFF